MIESELSKLVGMIRVAMVKQEMKLFNLYPLFKERSHYQNIIQHRGLDDVTHRKSLEAIHKLNKQVLSFYLINLCQ